MDMVEISEGGRGGAKRLTEAAESGNAKSRRRELTASTWNLTSKTRKLKSRNVELKSKTVKLTAKTRNTTSKTRKLTANTRHSTARSVKLNAAERLHFALLLHRVIFRLYVAAGERLKTSRRKLFNTTTRVLPSCPRTPIGRAIRSKSAKLTRTITTPNLSKSR